MDHSERPHLRIFLCGTKYDLEEERKAASKAIQRSRNEQISMELFGAHSDTPIETCLSYVEQCDIMIVIVAFRYGKIVPRRRVSFSEAEYIHGRKLNKRMLVYLREKAPKNRKFIEDDPEKIKKLERWKRRLQHHHTPEYYNDVGELGVSLGGTISTLIYESTRPPATSEGDSAFLAKEQSSDLKEVWVYAPHPLETLPDESHSEIRLQVLQNLLAGVKYTYFVESDAAIDRIADLTERLAVLSNMNFDKALNIIKMNVEVCILDKLAFLTHYTVHIGSKGELDVYQSVLSQDRKDRVTKLSPPIARMTYTRICTMIERATKSRNKGLIVRRARRHPN